MGRATRLLGVFLVLVAIGLGDDEPPKWSSAKTDSNPQPPPPPGPEGRNREGKNLLADLIGLGTGPETDPYLAAANSQCLNGDLAECFKSRALASMDDFFQQERYQLGDHARVVRLPGWRQRVGKQYEFSSSTPRAEETEWDHFTKFLMRKAEDFVRSAAIEVNVPQELLGQEHGRFAPRFVDEIASEIDIIEDKTENSFSRTKLKKLFIPLLIILKLFKLKLLLFLPFILGLASFKKILGFLALVVPGLIGFYKLCKPNIQGPYGNYGHSNFYSQPPVAAPQYPYYGGGGSFYGRDTNNLQTAASSHASSPVSFRDPEDHRDSHQIAYQGYPQYQ
ncbi:uncharacterized protein LOC132193004 [Neocloeon triangulifer]|uniref:uncharacterized protein LOC132193004 n=1 Tax=Neocloeon triangulifer TaxID=2078957 RepID=UPI00286F47CC|nr:uncharacterized protein LOC132193004 [Neocloeon triangulifer]